MNPIINSINEVFLNLGLNFRLIENEHNSDAVLLSLPVQNQIVYLVSFESKSIPLDTLRVEKYRYDLIFDKLTKTGNGVCNNNGTIVLRNQHCLLIIEPEIELKYLSK